MLIYYAHSKKSYGSVEEQKVVARLAKRHQVINPRDMGELGSIKPYLVKVNKSQAVAVSEYQGFIGRGVYEEVQYALYLNRPVYLVRSDRLKAMAITGAKIYDSSDWKVHYAILVKSNIECIL